MYKKSFKARLHNFENATAKSLLEIMERKQSNLSVAADVTTKEELIRIADNLGPFICVLKVFQKFKNDTLGAHLK